MLPHRPLLRAGTPVVWRTDTVLTVGHGPDGVSISGADAGLARWLRSLDGSISIEQALSTCPAPGSAPGLLAALTRARALDDASLTGPALGRASQSRRDAFAAERRAAVTMYGGAPEALAALARRARDRVAILGEPTLTAAVRTAVRGAGLTGTDAHPDSKQAPTGPALIVWCSGTDLDAWEERPWMSTTPHLGISVAGRRVTLGPLVLPGRTSCLRCAFLHRVDEDPTWPRAAMQLSGRRTEVEDQALASFAAQWLTLHLRGLIDLGVPQRAEGVQLTALIEQRWHVTWPDGTVRLRSLARHPACGCDWATAA